MELRLIIHSTTDRRSSGRRTEGRFTEKKIKREKGRQRTRQREREGRRETEREIKQLVVIYVYLIQISDDISKSFRCYYRRAKDDLGKILNRDLSR